MMNATLNGKSYAGNPLVRFDVGKVISKKLWRGSRLNKITLMVTGLMVNAMAVSAFAESLGVDLGRTGYLNVGDGESAVFEKLVVSEGSPVVKVGAGAATLALDGISGKEKVDIYVREGVLKLTADAVSPAPPTACQKAAFWVDANKNVLTDGLGVTTWLDARESTSGTRFPRAIVNHAFTEKSPTLVGSDGRTGVYFGGFHSGQTLDWVQADGSSYAPDTVRHFYFVADVSASWGYIFGLGASEAANNLTFDLPDGTSHTLDKAYFLMSQSLKPAAFFRDGARFQPFTSWSIQRGLHVFEVDLPCKPGHASNFFNDRDYWKGSAGGNRIGGDTINEVLVFTETLSESDRVLVQAYLLEKWLGRSRPRVILHVGSEAKVVLPVSLADAVTVVGEGTLEVLAEDGVKSFSRRLPLAVEAEDVISAEDVMKPGLELSLAKGIGAGILEKVGTGTIELNAIPAGVTKLNVNEGRMVLAAPKGVRPSADGVLEPSGNSVVAIPNAGFEDWDRPVKSDGCYYDIPEGGEYNGWHFTDPTGKGQAFFFKDNPTRKWWSLPGFAFEGDSALAIKHNASVWTAVTIPEDGDYELIFRTNARNGYEGLGLKVALGPDAEHLTVGGYFQAFYSETAYKTEHVRFLNLKAGVHQLWFLSLAQDKDLLTVIDDLEMHKLIQTESYMIPNGNFEDVPDDYDPVYGFSSRQVSSGWVVSGGACSVNYRSGSWNMPQNYGNWNMMADSRDGNIQLYLAGDNVQNTAETTFVATQGGAFVLVAEAGLCAASGWSGLYAKAFVDGIEHDLGGVGVGEHLLRTVAFPTQLSLEVGQSVRLQFRYEGSSELVVDNVRLVRPSAEQELMANGGFENDLTGWQNDNAAAGNATVYSYGSWLDPYYGRDVLEGTKYYALVKTVTLSQAVNVPSAGRYCLRFGVHARADNLRGQDVTNPFVVWWQAADGVRHEIETVRVYDRLFVPYAYELELPAGSVTVGVTGTETEDRTVILDGFSLKAAKTPINLVRNGSFEENPGRTSWRKPAFVAGWRSEGSYGTTGVWRYDKDDMNNQDGTEGYASTCYVSDVHDGDFWAAIVGTDALKQEVAFTAAGTYRFSFWGHSRIRPYASGQNPIAVRLQHGNEVIDIGRTEVNPTNFIEYAFVFIVPEPGLYELSLAGTREGDYTTEIDDVQILPVVFAGDSTVPVLSEKTEVSVAQGASLQLDFLGTVTCEKVRLGGRSRSGVLSAERFPEFISGPGSLYVSPKGMVMEIR